MLFLRTDTNEIFGGYGAVIFWEIQEERERERERRERDDDGDGDDDDGDDCFWREGERL